MQCFVHLLDISRNLEVVQLRQTQNRGSKSSPTAQLKDTAGENRGWLWRPTRMTRRAEGSQAGDCQQDNGGIKFQLTHPGAPLRQNTSIYWSGGDHPGSKNGEEQGTRRRDRVSEDEPAKSNNGRTGADPEEANQTTPPSGSLQALFTPKLSINFYALSAQLIF
ncbi:hypothetical protein T12_4071 [Trichinella patagoniensis]|uniref:Uncharacterized protein n=1 Tax=Trichinella patagoniensis TaxID=990121 RepID=A0A0V0ZSR7_9BILA|nr:hypothetical protein T12_4071 [Trichinella patagoniensis]